MEDLTKEQLILVALFISFVTSIATGIVTVSLMQQAPSSVVAPVEKIIEHTVEKAASATPSSSAAVSQALPVQSSVASEDQIVSAVSRAEKGLVRIQDVKNGVFAGLGIIVKSMHGPLISGASTVIVADASNFSSDGTYALSGAGTSTIPLSIIARNENYKLAFFAPTATSTVLKGAVAIGNPDSLRLGQTVIALSGQDHDIISKGIVTSLDTMPGTTTISYIESDAIAGLTGAPLVTVDGSVVGFETSSATLESGASNAFLPIDVIEQQLSLLADASSTASQ
jgi:hypothetical protein